MFENIKNIFKNKPREEADRETQAEVINSMSPHEYFNDVKARKQQIDDEGLQRVYDNCMELLNKYIVTGQERGIKKLMFHLDCIEKERELVKMGIDTFVYKDDIEEYILLSGTLGRVDVGTMINSHKTITENNKSKFSYLVSSIFPPKSEMQYKYPYVKKTPFLLPISWCHMWGKRLFVDRNINFKSGIKNRMSYTDEDVNLYKSLLDEMGFDGIGINNFGN